MSNAQDVLAPIRQFMSSRTLLTACELDLFTALDRTPDTAPGLAESLGVDPRALTRILDCLVTLNFLTKSPAQIYQPASAGRLLSSDHEETVLPMAKHLAHTWNNWHYLTETVRRGENPHQQHVTNLDPKEQRSFIGAMHVVGRELSRDIAAEYDASFAGSLLDIGGGSGVYTTAFLQANPGLRAAVFDLEQVIPLTRQFIAEHGLEDRVDFVAGDFYLHELPSGFDLALLSAIIHQNSRQENRDLYRKVYKALNPGGRLLIRDHIMDEDRTKPGAGAMFALNMLVNTRGGDTYTFAEVHDDLQQAGFVDIKDLRSGQDSFERMDCLVEGRKKDS
ncbi:methyltransferase [Desulfovermiculus halophilus]|jgi:SAM-dependent methyltransferase|uniref:methyltransferase n=1 Tax=Desulfovermiculus halophilus TaxID=339722 RepID=UPI000687A588|nr:methyltransferase [Desulfovermiculus halophilus]